MAIRRSRRQIEEENEKLKNELATLRVMVRAYMQSNHRLQDEVEALNASIDILVAEKERWVQIAKKADERRLEYVRANSKCAD